MSGKTVVRKKRKAIRGKSNVARNGMNIVIETKDLPVGKLQPYHENPNIGDPEKTAESLRQNGQYRAIVVNIGSKTGRPYEILAGNHTWAGMKKLGHPTIRCDLVDEDNDGAEAIMLADNGARDGSRYDESKLAAILERRQQRGKSLVGTTMSNDMLKKLMNKSASKGPHSNVDKIEDAPDTMGSIDELNNNVFFESTLDYDIPPLIPEMILDEPLPNMKVWAGHELDGKEVIGEEEWERTNWWSMWHAGSRGINWPKAIPYFYTDDFHFEPVYNDPAKNTKKILNLGIQTVVMPNYTIYSEMPTALWIFASYRSFFVGRYFQEAGLTIIPDIQTGMDEAVMDVSLLGIPYGAGVVATQAQMTKGDKQGIRKKARLLKEAEDRLGFKNIIVYGHTDADEVVERAGFNCNVIRITARTARRREYLNSGATINTQKVKKRVRR